MSPSLRLLVQPALRTFRTASIPRSSVTSRYFTTSSPKMVVQKLNSLQDFKETIAANKLVVIDAFAEWCGPCKAISPLVEKWSEQHDTIVFAKFDVDEVPELAQELGIRAMPTFTFFKEGEKAEEFTGANPPALLKLISGFKGEEGSDF